MRPILEATFVAVLAAASSVSAQDRVRGHLITFQDNGAWSWFEDERAIVDPLSQKILVGSCADGSGFGGAARSGDIDVACLDLHSGVVTSFELHDRLQGDDHNSPALLVRPDGRFLAMYGMHGGSGTAPLLSRWRISTQPGDPNAWGAERTFQHTRAMSYSNLHYLPDAAAGHGVLYNFVRATNFDPNVMASGDLGETFTGTGKVLTEGGNGDRPYVKYASDGSTRVHLITTERHPRDYDNSIYHGYVENGALHDSVGNVLDPDVLDGSGRAPNALTTVFATGTSSSGTVMRRAWTVDLAVDDGGDVRALFTVRAQDRSTDHRLFQARFDGSAWSAHEVCAMGAYLYASENDYTGLAALHPDDVNRIFVSTKVDPRTGTALAHYEIFDGVTADRGQTWSWRPVTEDSSVDNLRPIVPKWSADRTALLWFRGSYSTYTDYDTAVVGIVEAPEMAVEPITYHDATRSNTTLVDGSPNPATGPAAGTGAVDGRWHERTGFGNAGNVWTADEQGSEDVPMLRVQATAPAAGAYDVFAFFWSNATDSWLVRAGLHASALRTYEKISVDAADAADFTAPVTLTGSTVHLYNAYLGRVEVGPAGTVDVYIDDLATGQSSATRSWFDGIGLAPVRTPAGVESVGRGCGGTPFLAVQGSARIGGSLTVWLARGAPLAPAWLLLGLQELRPFDLGAAGFPGCTVYPVVLAAQSIGTLSAVGVSAPTTFSIANDPALVRLRVALQGVCAPSGGGLQMTAATVARIGY